MYSPLLSHESEHESATAQATLRRSLRPIRVLLSVAFLLVVLASPGGDSVSLGIEVTVLLVAVASANALVNAAGMLGWAPEATRGGAFALQIGIDALLALASMLLLDATATPLAWIALLLPVFDTAVASGALAAGLSWAALSFAYVVIALQVKSSAASPSDVLGLAIQQLAAVAVVSLPAAYLAVRLRDDLAHSHRARAEADRRADELLVVAATAQRLAATTDRLAVLDIALDRATALGFIQADVCEKHSDRPWRILRSVGSLRSPEPSLGGHLDEALALGRPVAIGGGAAAEAGLRLFGFRTGIMLPIADTPEYAVALRAWSNESLESGSSARESLELLGALTAGAWRSATTLADLETWSQQLAHRASHDELTGLANRAELFTCVERSLERLRNTGSQFAVLFLDLDGFKEVNDQLGHEAGDAVLQGVAERLRRHVRGHDVLARLGGDEFVVVLNDLVTPTDAQSVAERICEAASAKFSIGDAMVSLAASIGIAYARPGDTADEVLNAADRVMYEAKRSGGNRFVVSRTYAA